MKSVISVRKSRCSIFKCQQSRPDHTAAPSSPGFHWQAASVGLYISIGARLSPSLRQPVALIFHCHTHLASPCLTSDQSWNVVVSVSDSKSDVISLKLSQPASSMNLVQSSRSPCWIVCLFELIFMLCEYNAPSYWVYTCPKEGSLGLHTQCL